MLAEADDCSFCYNSIILILMSCADYTEIMFGNKDVRAEQTKRAADFGKLSSVWSPCSMTNTISKDFFWNFVHTLNLLQ